MQKVPHRFTWENRDPIHDWRTITCVSNRYALSHPAHLLTSRSVTYIAGKAAIMESRFTNVAGREWRINAVTILGSTEGYLRSRNETLSKIFATLSRKRSSSNMLARRTKFSAATEFVAGSAPSWSVTNSSRQNLHKLFLANSANRCSAMKLAELPS